MKIKIQKFVDDSLIRCPIELNIPDGTMFGILGECSNDLVMALVGQKEIIGDVSIDNFSLKDDFDEYIKSLEIISGIRRKRIESDYLSANDFLNMICLLPLRKQNLDETLRKKDLYVRFIGMEPKINCKLLDLEEEELLRLEFIAAFLNNSKVILVDNFFSLVSEESRIIMAAFIQMYISSGNICILLSKNEEILKEFTNTIYNLMVRTAGFK